MGGGGPCGGYIIGGGSWEDEEKWVNKIGGKVGERMTTNRNGYYDRNIYTTFQLLHQLNKSNRIISAFKRTSIYLIMHL